MSERLRRDLGLRNPGLEVLNDRFIAAAAGVKILTYFEIQRTDLKILFTNSRDGETLTYICRILVDRRSARLSTADPPAEDEEIAALNTTHIGAPKFTNERNIHDRFLEKITDLIQNFNAEDRMAYLTLGSNIMANTFVDVHQFYQSEVNGDIALMKIWSERPSLKTFFEIGPTKCLEMKLRGLGRIDSSTNRPLDPSSKSMPKITVALASKTENEVLPKKNAINTPPFPVISEFPNDVGASCRFFFLKAYFS